jgi:DNA repair photolyase
VSAKYRYFLALTSQLPFCGIPFRLDSYSACQFGCRYCFASRRGGATGTSKIVAADPSSLRRRFDRIASQGPISALDEMLAARIPLHFGGMSDPFTPIEEKRGVTLRLLRILAELKYPVILSTKGILAASHRYVDVLSQGRFALQYSFSSFCNRTATLLEPGTPSPAQRLSALKVLASAGIPTSVRLQPFIPTREADALELVDAAASVGARHFALEHLKLPLEGSTSLRPKLVSAIGFDLHELYRVEGAIRVGREWILPASTRLAAVNSIRAQVKRLGLSFGAADTDLLHWSDGGVCCSAADLLGMGDGMRFNFLTAVRKGMKSGIISFQDIANEWRPSGSISQFVNSHSRTNGKQTVESFIRARWNGVKNGPSPLSFFGVSPTEKYDVHGFRLYSYHTNAFPGLPLN